MIILDATTKSLEFKLGGTVTTNQLPFVSFYVDHTSTTYTPVEQDGVSNNTTAVTIVSAPGASTQRNVKFINIRNRDTVTATVTVQYNNNTTIRELLVVTLSVNDTLQYLDTEGWSVIDTNGQKKSIASVTVTSALPAGTNNIGDVDIASLPNEGQQTMANSISVAIASDQSNVPINGTVTASNTTGNIASDSADSGNPVKIGFIAKTADITAVANNDRVDAVSDSLGKQIVLLGHLHTQRVTGTATFTNTTAADVIAAQGAGVKTVVTGILVGNNHATVGTKVEIRDGTVVKILCPAVAVGGGFSMQNPGGIFVSTANTAVTARCVTTGADVDVSIQGYTITN